MYLDKPMLVRNGNRRGRRRGPGPSKGSAAIVVLALCTVNYFLFFHDSGDVAPPTLEERIQAPSNAVGPGPVQVPAPGAPGLDAPAAPGAAPELRGTPEERDDFGEPVGRKVAGKLKRGQTVLKALQQEGIDSRTALPLVRAMEEVFDFRSAQVGNTFEAWVDDEGQVRKFTYVQSPLDVYEVALASTGSYEARKKAVPTRVELARIGCAIKSSLYESLTRCGEGSQLASIFIDLFAWDVDFFQDVRTGDELRVIVEKISVDGKFLKYGRVLGAEYNGKFGRHRLVHYRDPDGNEGYYTADGRAARKDFLKSPLKYTRVSAGATSGIRANLKKASPVVYTAKAGTPVWAVAGGTVAFVGDSGTLGTTVTIKHDNGYTSTYGHLGKLGRGIKVGAHIHQKTEIGTIGQSGKADEPQLLFSLRHKGRLVNPLRLHAAEADPIAAEHREDFDKSVKQLLEDLQATPVIGITEKRS